MHGTYKKSEDSHSLTINSQLAHNNNNRQQAKYKINARFQEPRRGDETG